jgi:membrane protein YqaA with SNARE-associated domain
MFDPNFMMAALAIAGILGGALTWFIDVRIERAIDRSEKTIARLLEETDYRLDRLERKFSNLQTKLGEDPDTFGFPVSRND